MKQGKHRARNIANPSWFRETPHRWADASLPLAYALACVEVVAEKSDKARGIYQQIIEGWGNPEVQSYFEAMNSEIQDSEKEKVKQALIHPESVLTPDPNKPYRQLEDLFAKIKEDRDILAKGIEQKSSTLEEQTVEQFLKFVFLIIDFITVGFNRESDIAKGQLRVMPDNNRLLMAVIMHTSAEHQNIQLEQIRNMYKLRKHKGKVIDFHKELTEKPTGRWHRKMVASAKAYNLKLKNDQVIMSAARHWYQCRVVYPSINKYCDDPKNYNLDPKNISKQIKPCDDALEYISRLPAQ